MEEKLEDFQKVAVHVLSEKDWVTVLTKIRTKENYYTSYKQYKKTTCISIPEGNYSHISWFKNNGYKIISVKEFLKDSKEICKNVANKRISSIKYKIKHYEKYLTMEENICTKTELSYWENILKKLNENE